MKMRVAVVDCAVSGHRKTYYQKFVQAWTELGQEVLLLAPQKIDGEEAVAFRKILTEDLLPLPVGKPIRKKMVVLENAFIRLRNLFIIRRQLEDFHPDLVYFPCLDDILPTLSPVALLDRLFPFPWSGLFVQSALAPYKWRMPDIRPCLSSRNCRGIGVLNEYSIEPLLRFQKRIQILPDFADTSSPNKDYSLLKVLEAKAGGRKIISLLGSVNERKGIHLLLDTIPSLPEDRYFFLVAGKPSLQQDQIARLKSYEKKHDNCLFVLEHIPDEACFNALVDASDVLFAVYRNFTGSSNLMTKAAFFGKPIVVSQGKCMRKRVDEYHIGMAIPEDDTISCRDAIIQLCQDNAVRPEDYIRYASQHDYHQMVKALQLLMTNHNS